MDAEQAAFAESALRLLEGLEREMRSGLPTRSLATLEADVVAIKAAVVAVFGEDARAALVPPRLRR